MRGGGCDPAGFEQAQRWSEEMERRGRALGAAEQFELSDETRDRLDELGYGS